MERVTGIGGLFFRAHDPTALGRWYQQHLGVALAPSSYEESVWQQEAGPTVFSPFPETSDYFGDAHKVWMVNVRVRDLDSMAAQLRAAGITVKIDPQSYPNGRFARLHDPEGIPSNCGSPKDETLREHRVPNSGVHQIVPADTEGIAAQTRKGSVQCQIPQPSLRKVISVVFDVGI